MLISSGHLLPHYIMILNIVLNCSYTICGFTICLIMARLGLMTRALALSFTNVLTISVATINMFLFRLHLIDFAHISPD